MPLLINLSKTHRDLLVSQHAKHSVCVVPGYGETRTVKKRTRAIWADLGPWNSTLNLGNDHKVTLLFPIQPI